MSWDAYTQSVKLEEVGHLGTELSKVIHCPVHFPAYNKNLFEIGRAREDASPIGVPPLGYYTVRVQGEKEAYDARVFILLGGDVDELERTPVFRQENGR